MESTKHPPPYQETKLQIYIFLLATVISSTLQAGSYSHTDTIYKLATIQTREDADYIFINNFNSAGTCPTSDGFVVARFQSNSLGDRAFSIALSAQMAGEKVRLTVNDTFKNSNDFCFVSSIYISK